MAANKNTNLRAQAFLLANYDYILKSSAEFRGAYDNFFKLRGDPALATSKITTQQYHKALLEIQHSTLSRLVPQIRLFKVFYDKRDNISDVAEFKFDGHVTEGNIENIKQAAVGDFRLDDSPNKGIEDITEAQAGRITGAGLKSFDWTLKGKNFPDSTNNIKADMTLFFQSVQDLAKHSVVPDSDNGRRITFLDLVAPVSKLETDKDVDISHHAGERKYYNVRAVVRWSGLEHSDLASINLDEQEKKEMTRALRDSGMILDLNTEEHELTFNQNGTVELSIGFHAETNATLLAPEANILNLTDESGLTQRQRIRRLEETRNELQDQQEKLKKEGFSEEALNSDEDVEIGASPSMPEPIITDTHRSIDRLKSAIKRYKREIKETRTEAYKALVSKIIDEGRLYKLTGVPANFLMDYESSTLDNLGSGKFSKKDLNRIFGGVDAEEGNKLTSEEKKSIQKKIKKRRKKIEKKLNVTTIKGFTDEDAKEDVAEKISADEESSWGEYLANSNPFGTSQPDRKRERDGKVSIKFFFLGDLLDAAFEIFHDQNPGAKNRMKFIMGDLPLLDPYTPFFQKPTPDLVNIADIPISYIKFMDWFQEAIISEKKDNYPMKYFLRDVFNKLVGDILNTDFAGGIFNQSVRVGSNYFSFPAKKETDQLLSHTRLSSPNSSPKSKRHTGTVKESVQISKTQRGGEVIDIDNLDRSLVMSTKKRDVRNLINYIYFQPTFYKTPYLDATKEGAEQRDLERGVYWFNIGNDRGLFREMSFSRKDQPMARAYRITSNPNEDRFARLREFYKAEVRLHGNNMFLPGQIIFINPSVIGFGTPESRVAKRTGLLGYYQVIEVEHTLERGNWETILHATWCGNADGTGFPSNLRERGDPSKKANSPNKLTIGGGRNASGRSGPR